MSGAVPARHRRALNVNDARAMRCTHLGAQALDQRRRRGRGGAAAGASFVSMRTAQAIEESLPGRSVMRISREVAARVEMPSASCAWRPASRACVLDGALADRLKTWTLRVWCLRQARAMRCSSRAGFHGRSS